MYIKFRIRRGSCKSLSSLLGKNIKLLIGNIMTAGKNMLSDNLGKKIKIKKMGMGMNIKL